MTHQRLTMAIGRFFVVLSTVVLLPATNVFLITTPAYIAFEYRRPGVPGSDIYDPQVRLELSQATVRWLNSSQGIEGLAALQHEGRPVYNARELRHMADVKAVMDGLRWAWGAAALVLLAGFVTAVRHRPWRRQFLRSTFTGAVLLIALLVGILLSAVLSFDWFFVRFHQVFFAADTWLFNYEDSLIQFYPLEFWIDTTFILGATTVCDALIVAAASMVCLRRFARASAGRAAPAERGR